MFLVLKYNFFWPWHIFLPLGEERGHSGSSKKYAPLSRFFQKSLGVGIVQKQEKHKLARLHYVRETATEAAADALRLWAQWEDNSMHPSLP